MRRNQNPQYARKRTNTGLDKVQLSIRDKGGKQTAGIRCFRVYAHTAGETARLPVYYTKVYTPPPRETRGTGPCTHERDVRRRTTI